MFARRAFSVVTPFSRKAKVAPKPAQLSFAEVAAQTLVQIEEAILPLKPLNEPFNIIKKKNALEIDTGERGWFIFRVDHHEQTLVVQAPYSGIFAYKYEYETKLWLNDRDNHDMRGIVTRDFIKGFIGFPEF